MRVALVHDWLLTYRGGEKVLLALAEMFPDAPIYTLFYESAQMPSALTQRVIVASALNAVSVLRRNHRQALPLLPFAITSLTLPPVDLVISSSHCVAKGVRVPAGAKHLSYVHAPLRYMYDRFEDYFSPSTVNRSTRAAAQMLRRPLQWWDVHSTQSVDTLVANSAHVQRQIFERYDRDSAVVHPPVELGRFISQPLPNAPGDAFLFFGAAAPYKRLDLAIEAFARLKLPLKIAGVGHRQLSSLPDHVTVLGQVDDAQVAALYRSSRALIFPGVEDFGLTPLESMACGRPVIAYAQGGALETVTSNTGVFFDAQTVDSLMAAVHRFVEREREFSDASLRAHASQFSLAAFQNGIRQAVDQTLDAPRR